MVHSLLAAWRVSLHRTKADWPIVAAAALITLLSATLLAAGPIYSAAASEAGMRRGLVSAPTTQANIQVVARAAAGEVGATDAQVRGLLQQTIGSAGETIDLGGEAGTFAPANAEGTVRDLYRLGFKDGLADHATLISGAWPGAAPDGGPLQLAVLELIASELDLHVGDPLPLTGRSVAGLDVDATIVGIYRPTDSLDPFWWEDSALLDGVTESSDYRTFGPLMAARDDLVARATNGGTVLLTWHAFPTFAQLPISDVTGLRTRIEQLPSAVSSLLPNGFAVATTGLPALLSTSESALVTSRTGVLLLLAQLAILAGYAIALTADLIVDQRRLDTALLRSRGASPVQVGLLALVEAGLLAIPAALLAPWLAGQALLLFNVAGPLAGIGLRISPTITPDAYLAGAGAAIGCALLLVMPAFNAARSYAAERSGRARQGTRTFGQRLGLDIALLAVTAIGLWQLRLYGTPLTKSVQGALGIDPLLIAAPAIGILAGSVVALRIVPLLATVADKLAARGRNLVGSLGARQLARRPLRYTRTALLLILAMSMGVFSLAYGRTWTNSQADQAAFQTGADLLVTPARGLDTLPGWAIASAYGSIDGVRDVVPVANDRIRITQVEGFAQLLQLDPVAAAVAAGSAGPTDPAYATAAQALVDARPKVDGLALPGTPRRVAINAAFRIDSASVLVPSEDGQGQFVPISGPEVLAGTTITARATLRDASGLVSRFASEPTTPSAAGWQFVVPIQGSTAARTAAVARLGGGLVAPVELLGVDLEVVLPLGVEGVEGALALNGVAAEATVDGASWQPVAIPARDWVVAWTSRGGGDGGALEAEPGGGDSSLGAPFGGTTGAPAFTDSTGAGAAGVVLRYSPSSVAGLQTGALDTIVNARFLEVTASKVGESVLVAIPGGSRRLHITGVTEAFPTTDPNQPLLILDLPTYSLARFAADGTAIEADAWWIATNPTTSDGRPIAEAVQQARTGGPLSGAQVVSREATRDRLVSDPIALSTIGALSLGFVVAGLFAVIGLAVSAAVSARQRKTEFALLRALGLAPNQLSSWLWLENLSVILISIPAGTVLGLVICWVVLPFVTLTQSGGVPFPPVVVDVPWSSVLVLELISVAALGLTLLALTRWMRGLGVGSVLRMGED
jgi:hypothetical protein